MKSEELTGSTSFDGDCRCCGRQTIGNGIPFNPVFLTYLPIRRPKVLNGSELFASGRPYGPLTS
jgi:hypothetical protein